MNCTCKHLFRSFDDPTFNALINVAGCNPTLKNKKKFQITPRIRSEHYEGASTLTDFYFI